MITKLIKVLKIVISLPKTVYFNLKILPFREGIKMPFFIYPNVKFLDLSGKVKINSDIHPFMIRFGYVGTKQVITYSYSTINISKDAILEFNGHAGFAKGISLDCNGHLEFGGHFSSNNNCFISCDDKVVFGENVLLGDNIVIRDNDGHSVFLDGKKKDNTRPIIIGNHVWIASHSAVLKGSTICDESILAYGSLLTNKVTEKNVLIAGQPAIIKQRDINWKNKNNDFK